jgi:hypothetical protein
MATMSNITPKGKRVLAILATLAVIVAGWVLWRVVVRNAETPPVPFEEEASVEFVDILARLPQETDHYRIEYDSYYDVLLITPKVSIDGQANPQEEFARVWAEYEQYALEAIAWLKEQQAVLSNFEIEFWGQDFWPDGARISY